MRKNKKRKDFLVFGSPFIGQPEIEEVVAAMRSGWLGKGPRVNRFEGMFRRFKKSRYAIALNSCTSAIHLSLEAVGLTRGDEVIVPAMTYVGTANAILAAGGIPVFADCDKFTMNIDPHDLRRKITSRTKAVIPVHFAGRPCPMNEIMRIARKNRLAVVEDCAHAIEAEYHGKPAGTIGDTGAFSFYVTKNITTGDGGMVITANKMYSEKIKIAAIQGVGHTAWEKYSDEGYRHYLAVDRGYKCAMVDMQAALGIHQLPKIGSWWRRRSAIWRRYDAAFKDLPVYTPAPAEAGTKHARHLYTILLDIDRLSISRDRFLMEMSKRNIGTGVHYIALHLHPYYKKEFGYRCGDLPGAEWISERTVSLPISPKMTDRDVEDVVSAVLDIIENHLA